MGIIRSKYPGKCRKCGKTHSPGDRVYWTRGIKGVECISCSGGNRPTTPTPNPVRPNPTGGIQTPRETRRVEDRRNDGIPSWLIDWDELRDISLAALDGKKVAQKERHQRLIADDYLKPGKWEGYETEDVRRWITSGFQVPGLILGDPPVPIRDKRRLIFSEEGDEFHYDRAMSGEDNVFSEWTKRQVIPGLAVEAEISFSASVDNEVLRNYFSWICRAVYSLEENGVDCQVSLTMTMDRVFEGNTRRRRTIVRVKKEQEVSDFSYWSAMISPASFRTFGFIAQTLNADRNGDNVSTGQGGNGGSGWYVRFDPVRQVMEISSDYMGGGYSFPEEDMTRQLHEALAETRKAQG